MLKIKINCLKNVKRSILMQRTQTSSATNLKMMNKYSAASLLISLLVFSNGYEVQAEAVEASVKSQDR